MVPSWLCKESEVTRADESQLVSKCVCVCVLELRARSLHVDFLEELQHFFAA